MPKKYYAKRAFIYAIVIMNRLNRISAILIQLQSRKVVRAQDIADRFEISLRTVYRDIRSLEEAGIPLVGEAGVGYSLAEGYRLPPVMFSREEATAFVTAEKLVVGLTDVESGNSYRSALYKVRAVLKTTEKDYLENLDNRIEVIRNIRPPELRSHHNPLQTILNAIATKIVLQLDYFSYYRQEHTKRFVEPIGVFYLNEYWHLIAWCRVREALRDFRFDRILELKTTNDSFIDQHPSLKSYIDDQYKEQKLYDVRIRVDYHAYLHLGEQKYYHGYISEHHLEDEMEMQFMTSSLEGFARWFLMFADCAVILQPEILINRVNSIFEGIKKKLAIYKTC